MKQRIFYILLCSILSTAMFSQPVETIYLGTSIKSGYAINESYGPYNIGFNFTFFGTTYSQFYACSNGLVTFGSGTVDNTNDPIPTAATPNNYIAAFWDELVVDPFGNILYATVGAAPNRKLIIQFRNMGFFTEPSYMGTFAVILSETTNKIQVQYRTIVLTTNDRARGGDATIGIENSTGTAGYSYAYHIKTAVNSEKAVSFDYSGGSSYSINSDEIYDGVYLTTNTTLPEPGITEMYNPADSSTVGTSVTFDWASAPYASNYSIELALNPSLVFSTSYNAGSNLTYSLSGLIPDTTYYWTLFITNTTGITWNEIMSFRTSSAPPLSAVPRTLWVEQTQQKTIQLQYTGGDASAKTATVTTLPPQGALYQDNGGALGAEITAVPALVTDPNRNVIYIASEGFGNSAGNFNFYMHDDTGDSPEATVTINVSPPGMPNLLYTGKATTYIEMQFDRIMANPAGKESQFPVTVNASPATISSLALKAGDPYTIIATLTSPILITDAVTIAYNAGTIVSAQGGLLATFGAQTVSLRAQTITFPVIPTKQYGIPPFNPGATAGGRPITYSSSNLSVATSSGSLVTIVSIGTSDITARQAGDATYAPARYTRTLTVIKGDQTITFGVLSDKTFGNPDYSISATASSGLSVSFVSSNLSVATVTGTTVHIVGAGTTTITASQAGNSNWNAAPDVPRTLLVNKADQTITFSVLSNKTYGDTDYSISATASSGLSVSFVSSDLSVATVTGTTVHIVGAGTTTITASQAGNSNWNAAPDVPRSLVVNKADQIITFSVLSGKTYGDADYSISATASSGLSVSFISSDLSVATVTVNSVHIAGAGTAIITASQPGNTNYNAAPDVPRTLSAGKALLTFTPDDLSKIYLAPLPALTYTASGYVNGETSAVLDLPPSITTTALQNSPVGDYTITISGGNDNNYDYAFVQGTLTITKIPQTITISDSPEKLLVSDTYTLAATSTSGLTVSFESGDAAIATVLGNEVTGVEKGIVQIRAFNDGDVNYDAAEAFAAIEVYSTHKDIMHLFTPNNDGFNDLWELPELALWGKCEVRVFSRSGKLVFADDDYNNTWDGVSDGKPVPEGPYYFVIQTENSGVVKGVVNIIR